MRSLTFDAVCLLVFSLMSFLFGSSAFDAARAALGPTPPAGNTFTLVILLGFCAVCAFAHLCNALLFVDDFCALRARRAGPQSPP